MGVSCKLFNPHSWTWSNAFLQRHKNLSHWSWGRPSEFEAVRLGFKAQNPPQVPRLGGLLLGKVLLQGTTHLLLVIKDTHQQWHVRLILVQLHLTNTKKYNCSVADFQSATSRWVHQAGLTRSMLLVSPLHHPCRLDSGRAWNLKNKNSILPTWKCILVSVFSIIQSVFKFQVLPIWITWWLYHWQSDLLFHIPNQIDYSNWNNLQDHSIICSESFFIFPLSILRTKLSFTLWFFSFFIFHFGFEWDLAVWTTWSFDLNLFWFSLSIFQFCFN